MTIENMDFKGEEIIVKRAPVTQDQRDANVFTNSGLPSEKVGYGIFEVVKVGWKQNDYTKGDMVLINNNGFPDKPITVEGYAPTEYYFLGNSSRIFCGLNE